MLRNRKSISGRCLSFILTILSASGSGIATASDDVPVGYKADRYQPVWDRNPFTIVTPVVQSVQPKVFDKLVLVSWLNDGGNDVVFIQNIESNEVQKITKDPKSSSLIICSAVFWSSCISKFKIRLMREVHRTARRLRRLLWRPLVSGTTQNVQYWSQPSITVT